METLALVTPLDLRPEMGWSWLEPGHEIQQLNLQEFYGPAITKNYIYRLTIKLY